MIEDFAALKALGNADFLKLCNTLEELGVPPHIVAQVAPEIYQNLTDLALFASHVSSAREMFGDGQRETREEPVQFARPDHGADTEQLWEEAGRRFVEDEEVRWREFAAYVGRRLAAETGLTNAEALARLMSIRPSTGLPAPPSVEPLPESSDPR